MKSKPVIINRKDFGPSFFDGQTALNLSLGDAFFTCFNNSRWWVWPTTMKKCAIKMNQNHEKDSKTLLKFNDNDNMLFSSVVDFITDSAAFHSTRLTLFFFDRCCCGQDRTTHTIVPGIDIGIAGDTWLPHKHTRAHPTDAYGTIEFQGSAHPTKAQVSLTYKFSIFTTSGEMVVFLTMTFLEIMGCLGLTAWASNTYPIHILYPFIHLILIFFHIICYSSMFAFPMTLDPN